MKKYSNVMKTIIFLVNGFLGGFLGSFAGAEGTSKNWRRVMIPGIIMAQAYNVTQNLWVLTIGLMAFVFSCGYGVPSFDDEGSTLGKFFYKLTKGNELFANLLVRGTVSILVCLTLLSIPIIKGNWNLYRWCSVGTILGYTNFSWRSLGTFRLFKKDLLWSEAIVYFIIVGLSCVMIYF